MVTASDSSRREADFVVKYLEERILSRLGSMAFFDHRMGVVAEVAGSYCSAYLDAQTDYASPNFRIPSGMSLSPGNVVRLTIDPKGSRFVDQKF